MPNFVKYSGNIIVKESIKITLKFLPGKWITSAFDKKGNYIVVKLAADFCILRNIIFDIPVFSFQFGNVITLKSKTCIYFWKIFNGEASDSTQKNEISKIEAAWLNTKRFPEIKIWREKLFCTIFSFAAVIRVHITKVSLKNLRDTLKLAFNIFSE